MEIPNPKPHLPNSLYIYPFQILAENSWHHERLADGDSAPGQEQH